jgi:hypothetical protein
LFGKIQDRGQFAGNLLSYIMSFCSEAIRSEAIHVPYKSSKEVKELSSIKHKIGKELSYDIVGSSETTREALPHFTY